MLFDYRTKFENYSNEQLLQVMIQASQYQQEVVAIAKEILEERGVNIKEALTDHLETMPVTERVAASNSEIKELTEVLQPSSMGFWRQCQENFRKLMWNKTKNIGLIIYRIALVVFMVAQIYLFVESYPRLRYLIHLSLAGMDTWSALIGIVLGYLLKVVLAFCILTLRKSGWYVILFVSMVGLITLIIRVVAFGMLSSDGTDELYQFVLCGLLLFGSLSKEPLLLFNINRRQMQIGVGVCATLCVAVQILLYAFRSL